MNNFNHVCQSEDALTVEGILNDIEEVPCASDSLADSFPVRAESDSSSSESKNIFEDDKRKEWNYDHVLARCDMNYILKISPRCGVCFISIWKKTLYGRLLTEIKADDGMIDHFAVSVSDTIKRVVGSELKNGGWCLITAPRRRHVERNFATLVSLKMASLLGIPFYEDIVHCKSKQRMNAVFSLSYVPEEPNIIVFDDIVTTGSTLASIKAAFADCKKNLMFFTGINNKL